MRDEDNSKRNLDEDERHNSPSYKSTVDLNNSEYNDNPVSSENLSEQDLTYRNQNNSKQSSTNSFTHKMESDNENISIKNLETANSKYVKGSVSADKDGSKASVHKRDEVDDSLLSDMKKTLDTKAHPLNSLFTDMADLKDLRSKSVSNRTESLKSHHSSRSHESSERSRKKSSRKSEKFGTSENPLDITEMTVDCGSLLELYQNDYFDAFMHMYHLYHKKEPGVHEYLVNMLYTKRTDAEIGFYLPQLCQLSISKYGKSSLHRFLLDKASVSMHFALQLSWFYQAAIDDQIPKYDSLTQKMTQDTEMAVVNSKLISPSSFTRASVEMRNSEKMTFPCLLDRRLLLEAFSKRRKTGEVNLHELCTNVDSLLSPQMPTSLVHNTFTLSSPCSKVKLLGVHTKLGNPLDLETHPILDYTDDLHLELQKLMMKQRRLNYFNTLNNFVVLCMENSSLLTTETKREAREPLLKVFVSALNEWMLLRRSTVAAYEESFAYTGLSLPFQYLNEPGKGYININSCEALESMNETTSSNSTLTGAGKYKSRSNMDQAFSQILRIVESETKIFFSKKRAPFVFYVEMANLDEDIEFISNKSNTNRIFSMKNLYVFDSIVEDLLNYDLITQSQVETIKNPLECIRFALDMLPPESLERYKNMLDNKKMASEEEESNPYTTPYESVTVSRTSSSNWEEYTAQKEDSDVEVNEGVNKLKLSSESSSRVDVEAAEEGSSKEVDREGSDSGKSSGSDVDSMPGGSNDKLGSAGVGKDDDSNQGHEVNVRSNSEGNTVYPDSDGSDGDVVKSDKENSKLKGDGHNMSVNGVKSSGETPKTNTNTYKSIADTVGSIFEEVENPGSLNGESKGVDKDLSESPRESARDKEAKALNIKNLTPEEVRNILSKETFETKKDRIRKASPYGKLKSWDLYAFVVKGNDDLRQEKMANQILESFRRIFTKAKLPLWLRPIEILVTGSNSGIMEFLHDTYSVDVIKRKFNSESLAPVFEKLFHANIFEARKNFIESHAAYSIVAYLLQVKDRHNGNILLDPQGHVIHIDYGFCLSNFPGKIISFETTPFKLTKEYLDVIGGENSDNFGYFKTLVIKGLLEARKHVDEIVLLVEMMTTANKMPCFMAGTTATIEMFKERFMLNQSEETCIRKITELIDASVNSFSTIQYDNFQRITNGIM